MLYSKGKGLFLIKVSNQFGYDLMKREIKLGGPDLIRWPPKKDTWTFSEVREIVLLALKNQVSLCSLDTRKLILPATT